MNEGRRERRRAHPPGRGHWSEQQMWQPKKNKETKVAEHTNGRGGLRRRWKSEEKRGVPV